MSFEVTTAVRKMITLTKDVKVIQGATSSGKTYGIIPILYDKLLAKDNTLITVVAETIPSLKDGCVKIFKDFLIEQNRWVESRWIGNPMQYTLPNRSRIQFKSFDSEGKAKASGKREILFINEANHVAYPIADALMIRTTQEVWLDFNADAEFWAHRELVDKPDTDFLKLTYKDNESIPPKTKKKLLEREQKALAEDRAGQRGYWWNWWQVYGLGEIGNLQGAIFNNYEVIDFVPAEAKLLGYGMDFGYTNDPTTLTAIYKLDNSYIYHELIYTTGLTNIDIWRIAKDLIDSSLKVYADSSEPKSIAELRSYGMNVTGAFKGADSIMFGIQKMQVDRFFVSKKSVNLINEFRNYTWAVDRNGITLNVPIDRLNHGIDGIRYFITTTGRYDGRY